MEWSWQPEGILGKERERRHWWCFLFPQKLGQTVLVFSFVWEWAKCVLLKGTFCGNGFEKIKVSWEQGGFCRNNCGLDFLPPWDGSRENKHIQWGKMRGFWQMAILKLGDHCFSNSVKFFAFLKWHSDLDLLWKTNKNQVKSPPEIRLWYSLCR